jgi:aldehyde dehydrogenase (NAD+)
MKTINKIYVNGEFLTPHGTQVLNIISPVTNDTTYGLHAYIFSADKERAYRMASRLDSGRVCINGLSHDSKAPFGGFKQSGIGREYGAFGLEEYLEPKAILG